MCFSLPRADGGTDILFCRGITPLEDSGGIVQYLKQFTIDSYDKNGQLERSIQAPYAKMVSKPIGSSGESVPFILLEGIDRYKRGIVSMPLGGDSSVTLSILYKDLLQIVEASVSADTMFIPGLIDFVAKADGYGFSSEVFLQVLISRLSYPFILINFFLAFAILAWNYRIEKTQAFRLLWLTILPIFTAVIYFLLQSAVFVEKLLNYSLISIFHDYALPMVIAAQILLVVAFSVRFLSLHGTTHT
jgi:hypothetical protein